ncbi:MAG: hypothetical protein ABI151_02100 [Chitinophagaceae bacterium]
MKQHITLSIAATTFAALLTFTSCSKNEGFNTPSLDDSRLQTNAMTTSAYTSDRVDAIVKDLSIDNYSFSFAKANAGAGITRTAYGSDNYLIFADPQDMICPEPIRRKFPKVAIWKRPNFIVPTCPDWTIDIHRLGQLQELISKVDFKQYGGLKQIRVEGGGAVMASQQMLKTYSAMKLDKLDDITGGFDGAKFIMLGASDAEKGGVFTRNFYGYANLNDIVMKPYKINLKDLIKPTLKGCFDPLILKAIREKLVSVNPALYKGLDVTTLPQNRNIAVLH